MHDFLLSHLKGTALDASADEAFGAEHKSITWVLAHIAEYDARKRYLDRGYESLLAYCLDRGGYSEDMALKRIQAARVARRFPVIFEDLAAQRLHLCTVCLLAPHLTPENAEDLLEAARGRTKAQVELLVRERFPRSEMLPLVEAGQCGSRAGQHAPAHVGPAQTEHAPAHVDNPARSTLKPLAAKRFHLHLTMDESMHDLLRYAQELMSHELPSGDMAEVIRGALHVLVAKLEKRKFAATGRPAANPRATRSRRHIPAAVKRAVRERDGGRCTFVSEDGRRCGARKFLEFDHIHEVARGGRATVDGVRLRCRAHNQHTAEQTFGSGFMERKRVDARRAVENRARAAAEAARKAAEERTRADAEGARVRAEAAGEVVPYLQSLGFRKEQVRLAVTHIESLPDVPLEERVRAALRYLGRKPRAWSPGSPHAMSAAPTLAPGRVPAYA